MASPRTLPTRSGAGPADAALGVSARAGELWAKEALFQRHAHKTAGLAFRLLGRDEDVDDLVQESFVAALAHLDQLDEPQAFGSWLCGIVVRMAYKMLRRRRLLSRLGLRRPDVVDPDAIVSRDAPPDTVRELREIYGRIERLPPKLRVPLLLRRVEGLPLDEVAAMIGASRATAKRRIAEAASELGISTVEEEPS